MLIFNTLTIHFTVKTLCSHFIYNNFISRVNKKSSIPNFSSVSCTYANETPKYLGVFQNPVRQAQVRIGTPRRISLTDEWAYHIVKRRCVDLDKVSVLN